MAKKVTEQELAQSVIDKLNNNTAAGTAISDTGNNFVATNVEGALSELFTNVSNGKTTIATAITGKGVPASASDTFAQLGSKITSIQLATGNAAVGDVLASKTFSNSTTTGATGTMPNRSGVKIQICGYEDITELIPHPSDTVGQGLITGKNAYGITGYISATTEIQMSVANLVPANIKAGVNVGRSGGTGTQKMTGTFTSDANAVAANILSGKTGYVNGTKVTGTMTSRGSEEYAGWRRAEMGPTGASAGRAHMRIPTGAYVTNSPEPQGAGFMGLFIDDANFQAANIVSGKNILGMVGTFAGIDIINLSLPSSIGENSTTHTIKKSVTMTKAGNVTVRAAMRNPNVNGYVYGYFRKNGVQFPAGYYGSANSQTPVFWSGDISVVSGDVIDVVTYSSNGSAYNAVESMTIISTMPASPTGGTITLGA